MKKIFIKTKSKFPYLGTNTSLDKSIEEIKKLLRKFECEEIAIYEAGEIIKLAFKKANVPYILEFPIIYIEGPNTPARLAMDISGRVVFNELKVLLVNVEIGTLDFMQAMLRHIALQSPQGILPLGEVVEAQKDQLIRGKVELDPTKVKVLTEGKG